MDWIETAQKVAPWAGALPMAHKIVLSAIIVGLGSFILLLIWQPTPAPVNPEPSAKMMSPLTIIVESSGAAAEAAANFAKELKDPTSLTRVKDTIEKEQLKRVIIRLVNIEHSQAPLPWLLRSYVADENPQNWEQVKSVVSANAPIVDELVELLEKFDGDLVFKDMETYKQLRFMIFSRAGLYSTLDKMEAPSTPEEKAKLLEIAENFEKLILNMNIVQSRLATYLKS